MSKISERKLNLEDIEAILEESFHPLTPRPEFISKLRGQLMSLSRPAFETPRKDSYQYILLAIASIAGGTLFLVTGARAVLSLLGALGVMHFIRKQQDEKKQLSTSGPILPA